MNNVTVIIPALNEEATIAEVIRKAFNCTCVHEVIVIDDQSYDHTVEVAMLSGATVFTSTQLGKGASMRDGLMMTRGSIIVYLDADIPTYPENIIDLLIEPILKNEADFVKSYFDRQAGRVTELVAKPLLSILFPALTHFKQPLSGIIAGKKAFFEKIDFENDYGVDIGILLDMHRLETRIAEVSIGTVENKMKPWQELGKMSREVTKAILSRANKTVEPSLENLENINVIRREMTDAIRESMAGLRKMVVFDMDNTILRSGFIHTAAEAFGFKKELWQIVAEQPNPVVRTKQIARLLHGKTFGEIIEVVKSIPIVADFGEIVAELKQKGFITGIISDSYTCVTNHLKNRFGLDFTFANELEFSRSVATGQVKIPSYFFKGPDSHCGHDFCKTNALSYLSETYHVSFENIIAIGDGENDICMIRKSGIGIAFCTKNQILENCADIVFNKPYFRPLLKLV